MEGCRARRKRATVRVLAFASWPANKKENVLPVMAGGGRPACARRSRKSG